MCVRGALRRSGGYSFAGELDLSITPLSPYLPQPPTRNSPGFCNTSTTLTTQCFSRVDVAHLVLYHLSVCCKKKYFDFDREILPFTSENWDSLLLGEVRGGGALGIMVEEGDVKRGEEGITAFLTPFSLLFPSSQTLPRENVLPSSSLHLTATRTGKLKGGSER